MPTNEGRPTWQVEGVAADARLVAQATDADPLQRHPGQQPQDYMLAFAAGAMFYVVVEELIPEMSEGEHSNVGTVAFALGFVVMMVLDVALG